MSSIDGYKFPVRVEVTESIKTVTSTGDMSKPWSAYASSSDGDFTKSSVWLWKGDYCNLGAGGEIGIYSTPFNNTSHYFAGVLNQLPMDLDLYNSDGALVGAYHPDSPQWWTTTFNPSVQNATGAGLRMVGSIGFSNRQNLYYDFKAIHGNDKYLSFPDDGSFSVGIDW